MSSSSLSSASSKEFEYVQNADYDAKYLYTRVQPSVNSQSVTLTTGQAQDITIDLINKSVNLARSYVQMTIGVTYGASMAAAGAAATDVATTGQAVMQNSKAPPLFAGVAFYPEQGGVNVINLGTRLKEVNQMTLPYTIPADTFNFKRDNTDFSCFPTTLSYSQNNLITTCATTSSTEGGGVTMSATTTSSYSVKGTNDIQYQRGICRTNGGSTAYAASATAFTETCRYKLKDICPKTFLAQDIVTPPSAKSNGQLVFTMGFPEHSFLLASGTAILTKGACVGPPVANTTWTQYAGTVTITNFELHLAVETNDDVDRSLKAKVMSSEGFNVNINYPIFYQAQMSARSNHTVPYSIEPANGQYIREIFTSPVVSGYSIAGYNYDYNNLSVPSYYDMTTTSTLQSNSTGQVATKVATYYTSLDTIRQEPYDLSVANNDPWLYYKKALGKTAISTAGQYYQNFVIYQDFTNGKALETPQAFMGKPLGGKRLTYQIDATTPSGNLTPLNWNMVLVYGRTLRSTAQGVQLI